jgi:pimeloyl-ACP methyl ester carboxylesterase
MTSDEAAPGTSASPHTVVSRDGTAIGVWRSGSGKPLLLVHGTSGNRNRWAPVLPALGSAFTVYAMDRRGRASSGDSEEYGIEREFDDVVSVAAWVAEDADEPIVLLGHSYGGMCSLEAAGRIDSLGSLILYEPPFPAGVQIYGEGVLERMRMLLEEGDREAVLTTFLLDTVKVPPEQVEFFRTMPGWGERVAAAHTIVRETAAHDRYAFDPERFRGLQVPTLLLLGEDSPEFFGAALRSLDAVLPNSTLHVMPGQAHAAMDTGPEMFVREIVRFAG